jgi:lysophospholipase L1-like esterase
VELDRIIGPDLTGELPELIAEIRETGPRVAVVGYYDGPEGAETAFTPCLPLFDVMTERLERLAAGDPGLIVVDATPVLPSPRLELFDADGVHPSPAGSALIGQALARAIERAEG